MAVAIGHRAIDVRVAARIVADHDAVRERQAPFGDGHHTELWGVVAGQRAVGERDIPDRMDAMDGSRPRLSATVLLVRVMGVDAAEDAAKNPGEVAGHRAVAQHQVAVGGDAAAVPARGVPGHAAAEQGQAGAAIGKDTAAVILEVIVRCATAGERQAVQRHVGPALEVQHPGSRHWRRW